MKEAVLFFRGLGESMNANMLKGVKDRIDRNRYDIIEVPYSATFGPIGSPDVFAKSLMSSVNEGVANAEKIISGYDSVSLVGYSFGTLVVEELIEKHPVSTAIGRKIMIGATLASARRKPGRSWALPGRGGGIFGEYVDDPRLWCALAWPEDVVTSLPVDSLLRKATPVIHWMSFQDPVRWAISLKTELPKLIFGEIGNMADHALDPIWWNHYFDMMVTTGQMIDGYARRGEHTARYIEKKWFDYKQNSVTALEMIARGVNQATPRF